MGGYKAAVALVAAILSLPRKAKDSEGIPFSKAPLFIGRYLVLSASCDEFFEKERTP